MDFVNYMNLCFITEINKLVQFVMEHYGPFPFF